MRVDEALWLGSVVAALAAAAWRLRSISLPNAHSGRTPYAGAALSWTALTLLLAGFIWRLGTTGVPAAVAAQALSLMAAGTLVCGLIVVPWLRSLSAEPGPAAEAADGMAVVGPLFSAFLVAAALAAGTGSSAASAAPAQNWLYWLRAVLAGAGLGGYAAGLAGALWNFSLAAQAPLAGMAWMVRRRVPAGPPATERQPGVDGHMLAAGIAGIAALRFAYPWLTAAVMAGAAWSLAAYAVLWSGSPGELWLAASWVLAGCYVHAASGWRRLRPQEAWPVLILLLGFITAVLASWQTPSLWLR